MDKDDTITARLNVHLVRNVPQILNFNFPQVVRQHTLGVVGYLVWVLFTIYSSFRRWTNFENRLGFDKVITISWVVHFLRQSVDGTRWAAIIGYASNFCDLWPFDLISMSHVQVHTWPNFGENIYEVIVGHPVFRAITCNDLNLWPLIPKANQHIDEPKYICDQNWVKFPSLSCEIWCSQGFLVLWPWRLTFWANEYVPGPDTHIT